MTNRPSPPYPSKDELKATRAPAIVVFLLMLAVAVALVVMVTLQVAQVASFHPATFIAIIFGSALAVLAIAAFSSRNAQRRRSETAHRILSTEDQAAIDRVVGRIRDERSHHGRGPAGTD